MIPVRKFICSSRRLIAPSMRCFSSQSGPLVEVSSDSEGIATVSLNRPPVNSLNLELLQAIHKTLDEVQKNKAKGVILTSTSPTVFSGGLDIMEMYKPDFSRCETFWTILQDVWVQLYGFTLPTAAAINGHAPAGGCLLAMSCEYRVMVSGKFGIGLNETAAGIIAPRWFRDTMLKTVSPRITEISLTTGKMFSVDEALKVGMIDEAAKDKADAIDKCCQFIKRFDKIPALGRGITKQRLREDPINKLLARKAVDTQEFIDFIKNPKVQKALEMHITQLKAKQAK